MADLAGRTELHRLLGLSRHVPADELRWAYEHAMEAATRSGNMRHAMDLLKAYEALAEPRRTQFYGRPISANSDQTSPSQQVTATSRRDTRAMPTSPSPKRRRERKYGMALWARMLVYIVIAPATLLAVIASALHAGDNASRNSGTPGQQPAQQIVAPAETAGPAPSYPSNARLIPVDTPVDSQGYVTVTCTSQPLNFQHPGYGMFARPGEIVSCTNGAIPKIVK